jgi:16S rRNA (adenine1518-N6/adenine1519-N6)-dimethyltransferase
VVGDRTAGALATPAGDGLLSAADIRAMASALGLRPTKKRGQNFLVDPNTVRRLVRLAEVGADDVILEVGPGLGSLTLGLLGAARRVVAVEVDPALAAALPATAAARLGPEAAGRLTVLTKDALRLVPADLAPAAPGRVGSPGTAGSELAGAPAPPGAVGWPDLTGPELAAAPAEAATVGSAAAGPVGSRWIRPVEPDGPAGDAAAPTVLAANLPYNVAVPLLLGLLERIPSLERGLVMVQAEVADRLTSPPGGRVYGVPSVKLAWYAAARPAGPVPRSVFWPVPNVDSALVAFTRRPAPAPGALRADVFAAIDAAFAQRRKTLRSALAGWAGSPAAVDRLAQAAAVDPSARGETLDVTAYCRLASARAELGSG